MTAATTSAADPFLELRGQLDAAEALLRADARDARATANQMRAAGEDHTSQSARANALAESARRVHEAIIAARPRGCAASGYDEAWEVTCPGRCGQVLDYQRYLQGPEPGRWLNDDSEMPACPRCGHGLEGYHPDLPLLDPAVEAYRAGLAAGIRAYAYSSSEPWAENGVQYVGSTGKRLAEALEEAASGRYP